uniref:Si:ch73-119p20.1 n=1 Tax=Cyprinus carpio carpio TaxID=630221 RepID=A0A9J8CRC3_CYPCA
MEAKAKGASKSASKAEKKEAAPPSKPDPVSAEPAEPENPAEDGATNQQGAAESAGCGCEALESLKPFLIGGAVIALGAVLVGVILLAKKN